MAPCNEPGARVGATGFLELSFSGDNHPNNQSPTQITQIPEAATLRENGRPWLTQDSRSPAIRPTQTLNLGIGNMTHERDAWDVAGDSGNGIEGQHLKCAKGKWLLDEIEIETGEDGLKFCPIMETATVGKVLWQDQKIIERNVGRLSDGFVPPTPANITKKWNPYTSVMGVRCDAGHLGDLLTFTSSSWGGCSLFSA